MQERRCQFCDAPISGCNGFVNAGDFLKLLNGEPVHVREFCGRCDVRLFMQEADNGKSEMAHTQELH